MQSQKNPPAVGVVTLLMTDVEGSTQLWEHETEEMRLALEIHDDLASHSFGAHQGRIVKARGEGDSLFVIFQSAEKALRAAIEFQTALNHTIWPTSIPLKVRVAIHAADVISRDSDFYGPSVNRCARIRSVGHGGQILVSEAVSWLVKDAEETLIPLGTFNLKDLLMPEKIFQVASPQHSEKFPPLKTLEGTPENLPIQLTSYIGRTEQVAQVRSLLNLHRLVTLTGTGGSGKTRLSLQVGAEATDLTPDGIVFVDLSSFGEEELDEAIAGGLDEVFGKGVRRSSIERLKDKTALMILDNCEHVIEASALKAEELLKRCAGLRVLATSREALRIGGECLYRVESLALPPARSTLEESLASEAVQLFIERARERQPEFEVTVKNAKDIAAICREIDGIPLAIEHVAGQITGMSTSEIRTRLRDRFRLLRSQVRGGIGRHATIRGTLDWSYESLNEVEKAVFPITSVFRSSWNFDLLCVVCQPSGIEPWPAEDALNGLLFKSLISLENGSYEGARFRLLETTRAFASEKLPEEVRSKAIAALFAHYNSLSESVDSNPSVSEELSREILNLEASLRWAIRAGMPEALKCLFNLRDFFRRMGFAKSGSVLFTEAFEADLSNDPAELGQCWNALGSLFWRQDRFEDAERAYLESRNYRLALGDEVGLTGLYNNLAILAAETGQTEKAIGLFEQALAGYMRVDQTQRILLVNINLGTLKANIGDSKGALGHLAVVGRNIPEGMNLRATYYKSLALALTLEGSDSSAVAALHEAFSIWRESGDVPGLVGALANLAYLDVRKEVEIRQAILLGACHEIEEKTGTKPTETEGNLKEHVALELSRQLSNEEVNEAIQQGVRLEVADLFEFCLAVTKDLSLPRV